MAITSVGFAGNVDAVQWARLAPELGQAERIVSGFTGTTVSGGTRQVSWAAGTSYAHGVMATMSPAQVTTHATVTSGSRWDAVVLRRNWGTGATTLEIVPGSSTEALPATLNDNPGVLHDQALGLVQITAGQTVPSAVRNLTTAKRHESGLYCRAIRSGEEDILNTPGGEAWPFVGQTTLHVPRWATRVALLPQVSGVEVPAGGNTDGGYFYLRVEGVDTEPTAWAPVSAEQNRLTISAAVDLAVPAAWRGRVITITPYGTGNGAIRTTFGSSYSLAYDFRE